MSGCGCCATRRRTRSSRPRSAAPSRRIASASAVAPGPSCRTSPGSTRPGPFPPAAPRPARASPRRPRAARAAAARGCRSAPPAAPPAPSAKRDAGRTSVALPRCATVARHAAQSVQRGLLMRRGAAQRARAAALPPSQKGGLAKPCAQRGRARRSAGIGDVALDHRDAVAEAVQRRILPRQRRQRRLALHRDDRQPGTRAARQRKAAPLPQPSSSTRSPGCAGTAAASSTASMPGAQPAFAAGAAARGRRAACPRWSRASVAPRRPRAARAAPARRPPPARRGGAGRRRCRLRAR